MNKLEAVVFNNRGGPLKLKLKVAKKMPLPQRCYLWACIIFGIITVLPLFHYMSRWEAVNEVKEEDLIRLSNLDLEEGLVYSGNIIKSILDIKSYTSTVLENGLRVLVVSDPLTSLAAASCDVAVGSFQDPPNIPGLAHLVEHGLFLGDSEHKEANTFEQFLAEHSGHSNAFTSQENTNYYYKVSPDKLEESLHRFSLLLSHPLLELESLQREYHAIQSEFLKDKLESARQVWRLIKHMANPSHPFHRLSPGNLETLQNLQHSSVIKEFHSKHYYPENMRCVVYGREDSQDLLEMSRKCFSKLTNMKPRSEPDQEKGWVSAYPEERLGVWVDYEPLREGNDLDMIWPVTGASRCGLGMQYTCSQRGIPNQR
ncbi:insulin-degrading enzyme-like [Bolinopsis microptera]|uniref:insulin-degrading enzyme-like n=1 Tax=Bolinopsis microptera TaxID=2820187 RepID=UPI003078AD4B